jgi:5-formyltetrahydrofolate cyclo-ligase
MTQPLEKSAEHETRASIRKIVSAKRKALTSVFQEESAEALLLRLQNNTIVQKAEYIALYLAVNGELNLEPFIQWCWQQKKQVYLPIVHPFSKGNLLFLAYEPDSTMINNRYNIKEPKLDVRHIKPVQQLDIILTPLVAFDSKGERIGMGGGYYDRTLANWYEYYTQDNHCSPAIIGIAHDCQQIETVPHEAWDIPLPTIITPTRTLNCNLSR